MTMMPGFVTLHYCKHCGMQVLTEDYDDENPKVVQSEPPDFFAAVLRCKMKSLKRDICCPACKSRDQIVLHVLQRTARYCLDCLYGEYE